MYTGGDVGSGLPGLLASSYPGERHVRGVTWG